MLNQRDFAYFVALNSMTQVLQKITEDNFERALEEGARTKLEDAKEGARHADNVQTRVKRVVVPLNIVDDESLYLVHA